MLILPFFVIAAAFALAVIGHAAVSIYFANRLHATAGPRVLLRLGSLASHGSVIVLALGGGAWLAASPTALSAFGRACPLDGLLALAGGLPGPLVGYLAFCCLVAIGPAPWSIWKRRRLRPPEHLVSCTGQTLDLRSEPGVAPRPFSGFALRLPGNECLRVEVNRKELRLPRLDPELHGLRVLHISDLHFTGRIGKPFYERVGEAIDRLGCDLIALTGDVADKNACLDWIPDTLGRWQAPLGVYYVLGNHDLRVDTRALRHALDGAGLTWLGDRWVTRQFQGAPILLAGNERPWFRPAADLQAAPQFSGGRRPFRLALSHSPDQWRWAVEGDVDLLLAGHTHGGQIRLPVVGPVVAPSLYGVQYACGTFFLPPTVMHVSRGLSGKTPLRFNCPPEATELVLLSATDSAA